MDQSPALIWRKSSHSGGGNENCVEVAITPHGISIRDSKSPHKASLQLTKKEWINFLSILKTKHI